MEEQITKEQIKKLQVCVYIIIGLLLVNTIALFAAIKDPAATKTENETETEESYEYDVSMFEAIDVDGFVEAFKDDELSVVYFGRATCGYCVQFLPVLQQAQSEYKYKTLYVDISTISTDESTKITELDSFLAENYGATPIVVLLKDGKIVDYQRGYSDYSTYTSMLEKNGFTK